MDRRAFVSGALAMALGGPAAATLGSPPKGRDETTGPGFHPDSFDPGALEPPQFALFWNFSKPRTSWEAVSYLRLFFRPALHRLYAYFEGRDRILGGKPCANPLQALAATLFPETYGVPLFRGQTERAARTVSGLSAPEARTLAPRQSAEESAPDLRKNRLVIGAVRRGVPERVAERLPYLLYDDGEPELLGRCLFSLEQMRKAAGQGSRPPAPDWREHPFLAARRFNTWFEVVIRRFLRGHWTLPSGPGLLLPAVAPPEACQASFPDLSAEEVESSIDLARRHYAEHPDAREINPPEIETIEVGS